MGRLVFIGHGGFDTRSEMILVPMDTTITFLADAGSRLQLPSVSTLPPGEKPADGVWTEGVNCRFDYEKVANLLDNYLQAENPRKFGETVPNLSVKPVGAESLRVAKELEAQGKWGGEVKWTEGVAYLCTGDASTCPTPMLNVAARNNTKFEDLDEAKRNQFKAWVAAGATGTPPEGMEDFVAPQLSGAPAVYYKYVTEGIEMDKWEHSCKGLLGKDVGGGNDIIWLSCSGFEVDQKALDAIGLPEGLPQEMRQDTHGPGADWKPSKDDLDRIAKLNVQKIKDTPVNGKLRVRVRDPLVAIGDGHEGDVENYLKPNPDMEAGTITVNKKSGAFKGELTVEGISEERWKLVEDSLASLNTEVNFG